MKHRTRYRAVAMAIGLSLALSGSTDRPAPWKGPSYLMIRGGGLEAPVVIHHSLGGDGTDVETGLILPILSSVGSSRSPSYRPATERFYEVFEYWASPGVPLPRWNGLPSEPLDPAEAVAVSRIYPDEPGGAVWNQYLTRGRLPNFESPQVESDVPFRPISSRGVVLLRRVGLTFGV